MRHDFEHEGRRISYLDVHASAPHPASVVLLLHAFPLAGEMWEPQLTAVPGGWRFVAPDLRGFGRSSPDPAGTWTDPAARARLSMDDYARDALALLDHLGAGSAVVCGLSLGGYVAFALLRLARERVRGLVLADTRPDPDSPASRAGREQMLQTLQREGVGAVAEAMIPRLLGPTSAATRTAVVDRVRRLASSQSADGVGAGIVRLMTRPDAFPLLMSFDRPLLVVAGDEDEITGPDIARQMHGQVDGAELALIGGAGHLSNVEQPAAFNAALDRFLASRFIQP